MTTTTARTLHVVSPLMRGPDVLEAQRRLDDLGYHPGSPDGFYGVATATAVRAFQRAEGLEVDGVLGPATRRALAEANAASREPLQPSNIGLGALEEALKHIGAKESPPNSNRTQFGRWFGIDGVKWCNIFVSYCFSVGAGYTICEGFTGAGVYPPGCTYVPTTEAWLRATGLWKGRSRPAPGDIVIFNWDGGEPDHIGIVESVIDNETIQSVEGNTSRGNQSDGGQVMRRERRMSDVTGFGTVA
jgi:hypothetical protein